MSTAVDRWYTLWSAHAYNYIGELLRCWFNVVWTSRNVAKRDVRVDNLYIPLHDCRRQRYVIQALLLYNFQWETATMYVHERSWALSAISPLTYIIVTYLAIHLLCSLFPYMYSCRYTRVLWRSWQHNRQNCRPSVPKKRWLPLSGLRCHWYGRFWGCARPPPLWQTTCHWTIFKNTSWPITCWEV